MVMCREHSTIFWMTTSDSHAVADPEIDRRPEEGGGAPNLQEFEAAGAHALKGSGDMLPEKF